MGKRKRLGGGKRKKSNWGKYSPIYFAQLIHDCKKLQLLESIIIGYNLIENDYRNTDILRTPYLMGSPYYFLLSLAWMLCVYVHCSVHLIIKERKLTTKPRCVVVVAVVKSHPVM